MKNLHDVVIEPLVSERSMELMEQNNTYTFKVEINANKIEIKNAIEEAFQVDVVKVNTMKVRGKKRRLGVNEGQRPDWKKAMVRLVEGDEIEIFEGV